MAEITCERKGNEAIIRVKLDARDKARKSASGKSKILASTSGFSKDSEGDEFALNYINR